MKETQTNSEIMRSLKHQNIWCYKIADSPTSWTQAATRFTPSKPCDILACHRGKFLAIEGKLIKKWKAFGLRDLRDSQIKGLTEVVKAGGRAFVFLVVRIPAIAGKQKRVNRLIAFDFGFLDRNRIFRFDHKQLQALDYISTTKDGEGKMIFDLSEWVEWCL